MILEIAVQPQAGTDGVDFPFERCARSLGSTTTQPYAMRSTMLLGSRSELQTGSTGRVRSRTQEFMQIVVKEPRPV